MTRRNPRPTPGTTVLLTTLLLAGLALAGASAGAQEAAGPVEARVDQVGWWTARPGAAATAEGGFEVATNGAGDPQSVAAAQLTIAADTVERVTITLTESSALAEFGSIAVCRALGLWIAENPGALEDAPAVDCSTRVNLTRTTDAGTWIGDIAPLVPDGGVVGVAFLPEYRPPTPVGTGMVVRIAEIGTEATGTSAAPGTTAAPPASSAPTTTAAAPTPAAPSPGAPAPSRPVPTAAPARPADLGAGPSTTTTVYDTQPIAEDEEFFTLGPVEEAPGESKPWIRLLVLVPLSAAMGAGAVRIRRVIGERTRPTGAV